MGILRTFAIGLNALPGFVAVKTPNYTSASYAQALLKQAQLDDKKRYDNLLTGVTKGWGSVFELL